jgi:hypothetical protein
MVVGSDKASTVLLIYFSLFPPRIHASLYQKMVVCEQDRRVGFEDLDLTVLDALNGIG